VTDGQIVVGPVTTELLSRGVAAGKVPVDGWARRDGSDEWLTIGDLPDLRDGESSGVRLRAAVMSEMSAVSDASSFGEAALYVIAAAVAHLGCSAAIVHVLDGDALVVRCAHGLRAEALLGEKSAPVDPVAGAVVGERVARAHPASVARLTRLGAPVVDAVAFPLHTWGKLVGVLELAAPTSDRCLDANAIAFVEELLEGLVLAPPPAR
jgi:hypothetical protein